MTTTFEDAPGHTPGADEAAAGEERPRLRRFAPRRSRSASAPPGLMPTTPPAEPVSKQESGPVAAAATTPPVPESTERTPPAMEAAAPRPEPAPAAPARSRRSRSRRPAAEAAPAELAAPAPAAMDGVPLEATTVTPPMETAEPAAEVAKETPKSRTARSRTRRAAASAAVEQPAEPAAPVAVASQPEAPVESSGAIEAAAEPAEAAPRAARTRRTRRKAAAAGEPATMEPAAEAASGEPAIPSNDLAAEATAPAPSEAPPGTDWFPEGEMIQSSPGGDLDGTEALARALLEMFPPEAAQPPAEGTLAADAEHVDLAPTDVLAEAQAILEGRDAEATGETEVPRRRSRRGRRGGRGRRRGLIALPPAGTQGAESLPPDEEGGLAAASLETAPLTGGPADTLFVPESPPRPDRPWRERGPRRLWGRTYGRELSPPVTLPPPKPSNGARFAPIPQATPPLSAHAQPEPAVSIPPAFVMPDLRLDEPLAPGETRTERLLEAQTRLMQAMLEQQARQIEVLTASVNSLRQSVNQLSAGGAGLRTYQPRTGIFVDAPNVCYAAENARVNLDFGRMLKYLSRDRYLVHAFAYSPIIDDVREGIRYETQRFVAPFLRAGYKLVTKPLKRFADGTAKGNFDIELAVDIVTMSERLDLVVLVSGDSDFERMIELIQSRGVRVEVVAFASNVSTELVNIADVFIDINQHLEHMRAL